MLAVPNPTTVTVVALQQVIEPPPPPAPAQQQQQQQPQPHAHQPHSGPVIGPTATTAQTAVGNPMQAHHPNQMPIQMQQQPQQPMQPPPHAHGQQQVMTAHAQPMYSAAAATGQQVVMASTPGGVMQSAPQAMHPPQPHPATSHMQPQMQMMPPPQPAHPTQQPQSQQPTQAPHPMAQPAYGIFTITMILLRIPLIIMINNRNVYNLLF